MHQLQGGARLAMTGYRILKPGYNCWRVAHARRVAFLIDAADYFRAFREAAARTRHSLLMVGWDIDSRVRLVRDADPGVLPNTLGEFLNGLVSRAGGPHAYVLTWDFAMLYALDREWLPIYKLDWRTHRRLHFRMDGKHPPGGSHHQKIVVVDDALAFVGGLDLTKARWDTPEHRPDDTRRIEVPGTPPYRPFHDVMMLVEGEVAAALGELVRLRWERATGRHARPRVDLPADVWPPGVVVELEDVPVAIARTTPAYDGEPEVREVELLYRDAIRAARRSIYIENQFFTATGIADALAVRLAERDGPEVVLVLALRTDGWLSQQTMDVLRGRLIRRLREADRYGRLRFYYPDVPGLNGQCVNVHSKVLVIDDEFVRVGSANLNNRSMGIDTECDLAFESGGEERLRRGVAALRHRLLAEHLGTRPEEVGRAMAREGSLIAAIEALRGGPRTLRELEPPAPEQASSWLPNPELLDPERPIDPDKLAEQLVPPDERAPAHRRIVVGVSMLLALLALAAAWRWTPLGEYLNVDSLSGFVAGFRGYAAAPFIVLGAFVLGGLIVVPVTLLIVVTALAFGPWEAFAYSVAGVMASAGLVYGLGHALGRDTVRRFAGSKLNRLSRRLAQRGVLTMAIVRLIPVAPFTVVNLVAGASHIRFRDFIAGTAVGMIPGIAAITLFVDRVGATLRDPGPGTVLVLAAVVLALVLGMYGLRRWVLRRTKDEPAAAANHA
jgi:phosphatidylserine/phosphatidylglycerophosphate/cardiolipin synthase-like enzyme/uncharacterized membrane protein YdjX (TVP38/TMEM64 family)